MSVRRIKKEKYGTPKGTVCKQYRHFYLNSVGTISIIPITKAANSAPITLTDRKFGNNKLGQIYYNGSGKPTSPLLWGEFYLKKCFNNISSTAITTAAEIPPKPLTLIPAATSQLKAVPGLTR